LGDAFQRRLTGTLDHPFIVLFQKDSANEAGDGILVGEDTDNLRARRLISP
jgi:hypothetical protein